MALVVRVNSFYSLPSLPHKRCAMLRQLVRPSVLPVLRSGSRSVRTQPIVRTCFTHSYQRPPRSTSSRCIGPHIPIQSSSALVQHGPCSSCQSGRHPSYTHTRSFHHTPRVQGSPLFIGLLAALKVSASAVALPRSASKKKNVFF